MYNSLPCKREVFDLNDKNNHQMTTEGAPEFRCLPSRSFVDNNPLPSHAYKIIIIINGPVFITILHSNQLMKHTGISMVKLPHDYKKELNEQNKDSAVHNKNSMEFSICMEWKTCVISWEHLKEQNHPIPPKLCKLLRKTWQQSRNYIGNLSIVA